MGRTKRPLENGEGGIEDSAQPPRKRRLEYTDADAQLAKIYSGLSNEVEAIRASAAQELIRTLWNKSPDRSERLEIAIRRLVTGLCSGRKAARLGFSVPLPEVLRLKFSSGAVDGSSDIDLVSLVNNVIVWTRPEGNVKGPERRDHMHGRRFAYQAILQSDVGLNKTLSNDQWRHFIESIFELAGQKQWIRRDCGAMLCNYLKSSNGAKLSTERVQSIIQALVESKQARTPEGVGLWIIIAKEHPQVSLPKDIWHHRDPLSSKERVMLGKALLENAQDDDTDQKKGGYRQSVLSFAWSVVLESLYERKDGKSFNKFWDEVVAASMFSQTSSTERKSLGLQVFSLAISTAPLEHIRHIFHPNILRCLTDQRANKERLLFEATKGPLNKIVDRANDDPASASALVEAILTGGASNLDQVLKLKAVESVLNVATEGTLLEIANSMSNMIYKPGTTDTAQSETRRRLLADVLLTMVRTHKDLSVKEEATTREDDRRLGWAKAILRTLIDIGYLEVDAEPAVTDSTRRVFQARLNSCLNAFLDCGIQRGVWAPVFVVEHIDMRKNSNPKAIAVPKSAISSLRKAKESLDRAIKSDDHAFALLIALSMIQVYNKESDAVGVLDDAVSCFQARAGDESSITTLIELLLSFVSKPSSLFRKMAEQVFGAVAAEMTADSLQSLTDILEQKESLSGQQELFDQNDDDENPNGNGQLVNGENIDDEYEDVEDASDLELDNGNIVSASESEDEDEDSDSDDNDSEDEDSANSSSEAEEAGDEDEEAAFDRKLAEALKTSGAAAGNGSDDDDDEDESDMDDEQMMALEPHLNKIFHERQKTTSKTKEKKDAKENIINFKNRVLDLLTIYVKHQYANLLALDLLLPLTTVIRTTTSKQTADKAFAVLTAYFSACSKHKTVPQPTTDDDDEGSEACFELLTALHAEMKRGGSKLHATACSRASLFLSKVLCTRDPRNYDRIADMYLVLQKEWHRDPKCLVPQTVFTEWMSWSIETRRRE